MKLFLSLRPRFHINTDTDVIHMDVRSTEELVKTFLILLISVTQYKRDYFSLHYVELCLKRAVFKRRRSLLCVGSAAV